MAVKAFKRAGVGIYRAKRCSLGEAFKHSISRLKVQAHSNNAPGTCRPEDIGTCRGAGADMSTRGKTGIYSSGSGSPGRAGNRSCLSMAERGASGFYRSCTADRSCLSTQEAVVGFLAPREVAE